MKQKLLSFLFLCVVFCATQALAQDRRVSGTVTSDDGLPLQGVSVIATGSSTATQTLDNGTYSIVLPSGTTTLTFRLLGYETQVVTVGQRTTVNVTLVSGSEQIDAVTITGYGALGQVNKVGSAVKLSGTTVADAAVQSFDQALGGRAAGAQISIPTGVVGATPVIRIRGTNSISLSSYPLIVVDGVPTFTQNYSGGSSAAYNPLASINPDDIETMEVLKDASATAIYGSRAANGVLIITTKKGRSGAAQFSYNAWAGLNQAQRLPTLLNAQQYVELKNEGLINAGAYNPNTNAYNLAYDNDGNVIDTRWYDYIYRDGISHNHTASLRGGNESTSYYGSVNLTDQQGIIYGNDYKQTGLVFNADHKFAKIFQFGAKINYTDAENLSFSNSGSLGTGAFGIAGLGRLGLVSQPNVGPYNNDGSYNIAGNAMGSMANTAASPNYYNPVVLRDHNRGNSYIRRTQGNAYLQANPTPWLTLKSLYGVDWMNVQGDTFWTPINGDGFAQDGLANRQSYDYRIWVWTNTADLQHSFGDHNLHGLLGNEQTRAVSDGFWGQRVGLSDFAFEHIGAGFQTPTAGGGYTETYLLSWFGSLNYDFASKYYLNGSVRYDEFSAFGPENKGGLFYSVGGAYELSEESFWKDSSISNGISSLRLKASFGTVGNNNGLGWLAPSSLYTYGLYGAVPSLSPNSTGNPAIAWETSQKFDAGINFGILNDRFTFELGYYRNNINDLIYNVPQPPSAGLASSPSVNIGSMYNEGFEFTANARAITAGDFSWTPSFNITFNKNELTSLTEDITQFPSNTSDLETANITRVGGPLGQIFVARTDGVDPETGRRIFINADGERVYYQHAGALAGWRYADGTTAPAIGSNDQVPYANSLPRYFGGFTNNFKYKDFDLNLHFTFQLDYSIYWGTGAGLLDNRAWNNSVNNLNRWTTPGQVTDIPKVIFGDNQSNGSATPLDIHVYRGDFLKLRDITLGYTIPNTALSRVGISRLRVYASAFNAFIFTKYPGTDPEVSSNANSNTSQGVDRNTASGGRAITAGINLTF